MRQMQNAYDSGTDASPHRMAAGAESLDLRALEDAFGSRDGGES
jgi:hypothetical protein